MRYLLDTNIWIFYLKHVDSPLVTRFRKPPVKEVAVCSVVWAELLYGARKYQRRQDRITRVEQTLPPYDWLPFDDEAARHHSVIRDDLEKRGKVIGPNDLMIAAIARNHGLILVSNNGEFRRVDGLAVKDWTGA